MSQSIAEELARVPMSPNLMATLTRAADYARQQTHQRVTLEHVLLALTEDSDAAGILQASQVASESLTADVTTHLASIEPGVTTDGQIGIAAELKRVLEAAAAAAQQGRRQVTGAIVLAAIVGEGKSTAAQILRSQGLTFEHAIKALQRSGRPAQPMPARSAPLAAPTPQAATAPAPVEPPPARPNEPPPLAPAAAALAPAKTSPVSRPVAEEAQKPAPVLPPVPPPSAPTSTVRPATTDPSLTPNWSPAALDPVEKPVTPVPVAPEPARTNPPPMPGPGRVQPQHQSQPLQAAQRPAPSQQPGTTPSADPAWEPAALPQEPAPAAQPARGASPYVSAQPVRAPEPAYTAPPTATYPSPQPETWGPQAYASSSEYANAQAAWPPTPTPRMPTEADGRYGTHQSAPTYREPPPRPGLPTVVDRGRDAPPQMASGQLIENIPRMMRSAEPVTVEVRLVGTDAPHGSAEYTHATRAMSVRLAATDGGCHVESLTPETQWIEGGPLPEGQAVARWRWTVLPQKSGRRSLQLAVSTRWISPDGISGDIPMPPQQVTVVVRRRWGRAFGRLLAWLMAIGLGAGLALLGGGLWKALLQIGKPLLGLAG